MPEVQPDMLGGKDRAGRSLPRVRRRAAAKVTPAGHYDKPGTGPEGQTCAGCTYMETFHYARTYHKCGAKPGHHWKGGRATDIRPLDAACSKFERVIQQITAPIAGPATPDEVIAGLGTGSHRVGKFDILIAPAVKTAPRNQEQDHGRQISFFD